MDDKKLEKKIQQDAEKVKKDLNTLGEDGADRLERFPENVSQMAGKAKDDITSWVEDSVSQLSDGIEKLTGEAKDGITSTAASLKKDVGHKLVQYNAKAGEVASNISGDLSKKVTKYPWVAITIGIAVGFMVAYIFKPSQRS